MTRPFLLGLTGSIGMGKSTTARMFAELGLAVWDADAAVHRLYQGEAVAPIGTLCPDAVKDGAVDRAALRAWIGRDPQALKRIEDVIHPLVAADRAAFIASAPGDILILDIPLLFETGADRAMDATLVVSAPAEVQRARVLSRPGMTEAQLQTILARQMPDAEKRRRATHVIETTDLESTRQAVQALVAEIRGRKDA